MQVGGSNLFQEEIIMKIPTIDMAATGRNISDMRKRAGITVSDLQAILGFNTPQAIFKWTRGDTLPTVDNLVILASVFGVKVDDILVIS